MKGDYTDKGELQIDGTSSRGGPLNLAEVYVEPLNASFAADSLQIIKEKDPKSFFFNIIISRLMLRIYSQWLADNFIINGVVRPEGNNIYILRSGIDWPISLILEGSSRTSITAWAQSLGLYNYICGYMDFNSNTFRNDIMYNVIDVIAPHYLKLKHRKELSGAQ